MAITFMAKYNEREGNSCHIHLSLQREDGTPVFADDDSAFERFLAGQLACLAGAVAASTRRTSTPTSASRPARSRRPRSRGASTTARARCASSATVRAGESNAGSPGADVNPYLALSAMIASGLHGMDEELALEPAFEGNAYASDKPRVPSNLRDARDAFAASAVARDAFGEDVVDHYLNNARIELEAFDAAVTDWERARGFERL